MVAVAAAVLHATVVRQAHLLFTSIGGHVEQIVQDYGVSRDRVVRLPIWIECAPWPSKYCGAEADFVFHRHPNLAGQWRC
jgi:hypothetical protein